jgi:hypothetical protein
MKPQAIFVHRALAWKPVNESRHCAGKQKGIGMKLRNAFVLPLVALVLTPAVIASAVSVDYDHSKNFTQLKTYSWTKVSTANSLWNRRVKDAVDRELTARGYTHVPSGGDLRLVAIEKTSVHQQYDTFYDGFGGRRWGGMGESTTSLDSYNIGALIVNMFDGDSKQLVWRGTGSEDL